MVQIDSLHARHLRQTVVQRSSQRMNASGVGGWKKSPGGCRSSSSDHRITQPGTGRVASLGLARWSQPKSRSSPQRWRHVNVRKHAPDHGSTSEISPVWTVNRCDHSGGLRRCYWNSGCRARRPKIDPGLAGLFLIAWRYKARAAAS